MDVNRRCLVFRRVSDLEFRAMLAGARNEDGGIPVAD